MRAIRLSAVVIVMLASGLWAAEYRDPLPLALIREPVSALQSTAARHVDVKLGKLRIVLEQTRLAEIQRRYGSTIGHSGDASNSLRWLCYPVMLSSPATVWLMSTEMAGPDAVVTEIALDAGPAPAACPTPSVQLPISWGTRPSLGAHRAAVQRYFGQVSSTPAWVAYRSIEQLPKNGTRLAQSEYYFEHDRTVRVVISQATSY